MKIIKHKNFEYSNCILTLLYIYKMYIVGCIRNSAVSIYRWVDGVKSRTSPNESHKINTEYRRMRNVVFHLFAGNNYIQTGRRIRIPEIIYHQIMKVIESSLNIYNKNIFSYEIITRTSPPKSTLNAP